MWVMGRLLSTRSNVALLPSIFSTMSQYPGPTLWLDRKICVFMCACLCACTYLTLTENQKNMIWLFSNNSSLHCCSGLDCCCFPAKQPFPVDFLKLLGVKSWAL